MTLWFWTTLRGDPMGRYSGPSKAQDQRMLHDKKRIRPAFSPNHEQRLRRLVSRLFGVSERVITDGVMIRVPPFTSYLYSLSNEDDDCTSVFAGHRPSYCYFFRYFGLNGFDVMTTDMICDELDVAPTTVRNACNRCIADLWVWMRDAWQPEVEALERLLSNQRSDSLMRQRDQTFFDRVNMSGDCWMWEGGTDLGYGVLKRNKKKVQAHRYAWEMIVDTLNPGVRMVNECGFRNCVNPSHWHLD